MARQSTGGAPGWRELRAHRIAEQRRPRAPKTDRNLQRASERDDLYMELTGAGIAPARAAALVEKQLPYPDQSDNDTEEDGPRRGAKPAKRVLLRYDRVPLALFGFAILGVWWAAGGRYTIDGTPLLINAILEFFHISARLGVITDPVWYLRLCWLPIAISIIERKNRPRMRMDWNVTIVYAVGIWLIVSGADLGSTWLAVTHPDPDAWPLAQQVGQIPFLAALWTIATTFAPEIGFAALWKYMRG